MLLSCLKEEIMGHPFDILETRRILKINIWFFLEMKINNQTKGMLKIKMQTIGLLRKIVHVYENGIKSLCGIVYIYICI